MSSLRQWQDCGLYLNEIAENDRLGHKVTGLQVQVEVFACAREREIKRVSE